MDSRLQPTSTIGHRAGRAAAAAASGDVHHRRRRSAYYGERGDQPLPESAAAGTGFLADLVRRVGGRHRAGRGGRGPGGDAAHRPGAQRQRRAAEAAGAAVQARASAASSAPASSTSPGSPWPTRSARSGTSCETDAVTGPVNLAGPEPVRNAEFTAALARCCTGRRCSRRPPSGSGWCWASSPTRACWSASGSCPRSCSPAATGSSTPTCRVGAGLGGQELAGTGLRALGHDAANRLLGRDPELRPRPSAASQPAAAGAGGRVRPRARRGTSASPAAGWPSPAPDALAGAADDGDVGVARVQARQAAAGRHPRASRAVSWASSAVTR